MKVIGTIIARLESKRLIYKNLLPFNNQPMLGIGILKLQAAELVDQVVVSTENELIARVAYTYGVTVLKRPQELALDNVPSVPVFQHIMEYFEGDMYVNLNINFPSCEVEVINRAVRKAVEYGESLSVPHAVWAHSRECLTNYGDPWKITAHRFKDDRAGNIDIHTQDDLLKAYRNHQKGILPWIESTENIALKS